MKKFIFVTLAVLSTSSFASSLVCSGERLYSSDVRFDFGTMPPVGAVTGKHVIVFDGEVVLSHEDIQGLHVHGVPPYQLSFESDQKTLEEVQSPAHHQKTYTVTGILQKVNSLTGEVLEELGRETVVCRSVFNMVP